MQKATGSNEFVKIMEKLIFADDWNIKFGGKKFWYFWANLPNFLLDIFLKIVLKAAIETFAEMF